MLRQHCHADWLVDDVRYTRFDVGQNESLDIGEFESSEVRSPVHDGGELATGDVEQERDALRMKGDHAVSTLGHGFILPSSAIPGALPYLGTRNPVARFRPLCSSMSVVCAMVAREEAGVGEEER
jgi:hypothetical protein